MFIARELFKAMNKHKGHTSIVNRLYVMNIDNNIKNIHNTDAKRRKTDRNTTSVWHCSLSQAT